ncbi:MAG: cob(I)yrinic acid a,c-diamide adenosyltransferase [bacterium]
MLYTKKGDDGKTTIFGCDQRLSKSSAIAEALGALDEANSYLGVCKEEVLDNDVVFENKKFSEILHNIQNNLFTVQAEVAGAPKNIDKEKLADLEKVLNAIEATLPEQKTFIIPGGTKNSAHLDFARTLIRRAERRVVAVTEEGIAKITPETLAYLNRLSSFLYAGARLYTHKSGIKEEPPRY